MDDANNNEYINDAVGDPKNPRNLAIHLYFKKDDKNSKVYGPYFSYPIPHVGDDIEFSFIVPKQPYIEIEEKPGEVKEIPTLQTIRGIVVSNSWVYAKKKPTSVVVTYKPI